MQQRARPQSYINGNTCKEIPKLTIPSGFIGKRNPLFSLSWSPVVNGNTTVGVAATGGINEDNAEAYAATGVDVLVTSAPYFAPPLDVKWRWRLRLSELEQHPESPARIVALYVTASGRKRYYMYRIPGIRPA